MCETKVLLVGVCGCSHEVVPLLSMDPTDRGRNDGPDPPDVGSANGRELQISHHIRSGRGASLTQLQTSERARKNLTNRLPLRWTMNVYCGQ